MEAVRSKGLSRSKSLKILVVSCEQQALPSSSGEPVMFHLRVQRRRLHSKKFGSVSLVAATALERASDQFNFVLFDLFVEVEGFFIGVEWSVRNGWLYCEPGLQGFYFVYERLRQRDQLLNSLIGSPAGCYGLELSVLQNFHYKFT